MSVLGKSRSIGTLGSHAPVGFGTTIAQLPIGGGGFCTSVTVSNDGKTVLCSNDSGMAFKWNSTTSHWDTLTDKFHLPVGFQSVSSAMGCYAIAVAPSDSTRIYMLNDGWLFKSTNSGTSFSQLPAFSTAATGSSTTQLPRLTVNANGGAPRLFDHKIAIDPINPDRMIVGTGISGCFMTTNGGTSFTQLSNVATGVPPSVTTKTVSGNEQVSQDFTVVTTAATTNSNIITFASNPGLDTGDYVYDQTSFTIPANVTVLSATSTTATLSQTIASIPIGHTIAATNVSNLYNYPAYNICFDPTTAAQSGGSTQIIYIASIGNPVYKSTDGGNTWAALAAGPSGCQSIGVGPDQVLWIVSQGSDFSGSLNNVWSCTTGGTWTQRTKTNVPQGQASQGLAVAAYDSSSSYRIIVLSNSLEGFAYTSNNFATNGSTFAQDDAHTIVSADATWLNSHLKPSVGSVAIDPSQANLLWVTSGLGMYQMSVPATPSTAVTYTGIVNGIENLAGVASLSSPGPGVRKTWVSVLDQGVFKIDPLGSLATSSNRLIGSVTAICPGFGMDYASSDSSFYCAAVGISTTQAMGFSTDGGQTYTLFPTQQTVSGGGIAATNTTDMVLTPAAPGNSALPRVTNDQGVTWHTPLSLPAEIVSLATTAATTSSPVLQFSSVTGVRVNSLVVDNTNPSSIPTETFVQSISSANLTVTLTNSVTVASGDTIQFLSGLGYVNSEFNYGTFVCADRDTSNPATFYIFYSNLKTNPLAGVWRSTDRGNTWSQRCQFNTTKNDIVGCNPTNINNQIRLTSWPGEPYGTLLHKGGSTNTISISSDGGSTWSLLNSSLTNVFDYGYGAARPGASHTTLWVIGTVSGVSGIYKSHDKGQSFVQISDLNPGGVLPIINNITGDMNIYGRCYFNASGLGFFYSTYISGP